MAGKTTNTNNGGGLYTKSLPTIADVVSKKIGETIDLSSYQLRNTHSTPDNAGWFYSNHTRHKYTDYRKYIDEVYTKNNDVPITEFTAYSTPFKTIDSMLGSQDHITDMVLNNTPFPTVVEMIGKRGKDTVMAMYGHEAGRNMLYKTYSATKLHHNVYHGRGVSRGINNTLGLVGQLEGFNIYVNPETGRAGDFDYMTSTYANYDNTIGSSVDYEDLERYFRIDTGFEKHLYAEGRSMTQSSVEALRKNLYTGENVLAEDSGNIGNKYRNDGDDAKLYRGGDYGLHANGSNNTGSLLSSGHYYTIKHMYRESQSAWQQDNSSFWKTKSLLTSVYAGDIKYSNETLLGKVTRTEGVDGTYAVDDETMQVTKSRGSDMLRVTNSAFSNGVYKTLISRFCGSEEKKTDETQTAIDEVYGISHGRNLLTKNAEKYGRNLLTKNAENGNPDTTNGYINPYCRVWTNHHEYSQYKKAIRPFSEGLVPTQEAAGTNKEWDEYRTEGGSRLLDDNSVISYGTNTVRITPTVDPSNGMYAKDVKRCMFSIENLAWKGFTDGLFEDQKGPFGGRIMWFPPYGLTFNENTNVNWSENEFIGRGEKIFTYVNSERRGNIDFKLLIDHPSTINFFKSDDEGGKVTDNDLLRFYAGCDVPTNDKPKKPEPKYSLTKEGSGETTTEQEDKKIRFYVFFPNNYSGQEDGELANDPYYPIVYLLNGVGTGEYVDGDTTKTIPLYDNNGSKLINEFESVESFTKDGVEYSLKNKSNIATGVMQGYEMGTTGVGLVKDSTVSGFHDSGSIKNVRKGDTDIEGYALVTKGATSGQTESYVVAPFVTQRKNKNEAKQDWFYRIDKSYRGVYTVGGNTLQEVLAKSNYTDNASYGLNSIKGLSKVKSKLCSNMDNDVTLVSFADVAVALMGDKLEGLSEDLYNKDNVKVIQGILDKNTISKIHINGFANEHGHDDRNVKLAERRGGAILKWLYNAIKELKDFDREKASVDSVELSQSGDSVEDIDNNTNNTKDIEAKIRRGAEVNLSYRLKEKNIITRESYKISISEKTLSEINEELGSLLTSPLKSESELMAWAAANGYTCTKSATNQEGEQKINGYGNEYRFFKQLKKENPTAFNKLMTKIKYFEPSYHSISPEGYIERLNFLNQCTRQGATNTESGNAANNLAFGRPPVCVLRIGDFFYTKILITGINIEYGETTWDFNPEGAGMQPMYANVSITFIFQGGSDITGPVSRLQDAMSFNYYANMGITSPYAESMDYDEYGNVIGIKPSPLSRTKTETDTQ